MKGFNPVDEATTKELLALVRSINNRLWAVNILAVLMLILLVLGVGGGILVAFLAFLLGGIPSSF